MKIRKAPERMCIGCREMKPKAGLIRIVKNKENEISVDKTKKSNGRGAYICKNSSCLENARKHKGLERALEAKIPEEIYNELKLEIGEAK
ncbi:MAG: YlxR family protein [Eubacteriales bacterium]|nr:YlxR family protein [Eubacteriales bacterium]